MGNAAGFTSFGGGVVVYASAFQRAPLLGGRVSDFVGVSAAAPEVVNLAAKLMAKQPQLQPSQIIDLIKRGASRNEEGLAILNPRRSWQLLADDSAKAGQE